MSKTFLITFTPEEPYFFGNEKSFTYPGQKNGGQFGNRYYIKSEQMPSQSTLFGALRYLLIPDKKYNYDYNKSELEATIGASSFNIASPEKQAFGVIEKMSPVFLIDKNGNALFPTPKNHRIKTEKNDNKQYTPFSEYETVSTADGARLFARDYVSKDGITDSFMCIADGTIVPSYTLFGSTLRIGINRQEKDMFKKMFCVLKKGYAFAVYATLADDAKVPASEAVYLGQNKSLFHVRICEQTDDTQKSVKALLKKGTPDGKYVAYCAADLFADKSIYDFCDFAVATTKTYRSYLTNAGRVTKQSTLYNIISAGSVFIIDRDKLSNFKSAVANANAEQIGYNNLIITDEGE
ncbi:MAG: hypothetical protein IJC45_08910 [Clostridia bacterium]|nr:hypothetical protein [Clostridia bacterium]